MGNAGCATSERRDWIVIDFETASRRETPCQVAALRYHDGVEADSFTSYIFQPEASFDEFNTSLHRITPQMVEGAPPWPVIWARLVAFAGEAPWVAHYAPFDMGVVRDACELSQLEWPMLRYTCTVAISRATWPGLSSYSLPRLCYGLGIPLDPSRYHEALYDARLAGEVLRLAIAMNGATGLQELLEKTRICFGEIWPDGWFGSRRTVPSLAGTRIAEGVPQASPDADPNSPFFGKSVVFTGELAMPRRHAWELVAEKGGHPTAAVTKRTDMLICGYQNITKLADGVIKSGKLMRAECLYAKGQSIEILDEMDFLRLLGGVDHTATELTPAPA